MGDNDEKRIDYAKLGRLRSDKGNCKSFECGCTLVEATVSPMISPCCYEHESLLAGEMSGTLMPFGKYRGQKVEDLPYDYLVWLEDQDLKEPLRSRVNKLVNSDFA